MTVSEPSRRLREIAKAIQELAEKPDSFAVDVESLIKFAERHVAPVFAARVERGRPPTVAVGDKLFVRIIDEAPMVGSWVAVEASVLRVDSDNPHGIDVRLIGDADAVWDDGHWRISGDGPLEAELFQDAEQLAGK